MRKLKQLIYYAVALVIMLIPGAPLIMKWMAVRKARQHLGEQEYEIPLLNSNQDIQRKILFFYAPFCIQSKAIMPMIERLQKEYPGLIKVDATQKPELAKVFGVTVTPTFIVTDENCVSEVKIGASSEAWIRKRLSGESRSKKFANSVK